MAIKYITRQATSYKYVWFVFQFQAEIKLKSHTKNICERPMDSLRFILRIKYNSLDFEYIM